MKWTEVKCNLKEDFIIIIENMKTEELSDKIIEIEKKFCWPKKKRN